MHLIVIEVPGPATLRLLVRGLSNSYALKKPALSRDDYRPNGEDFAVAGDIPQSCRMLIAAG